MGAGRLADVFAWEGLNQMEPLIIECALNEQVTVAQNPAVPISPEEVARDALEVADAGAAIVHFHARDVETGDLLHPGTEWYREAMKLIRKANTDIILYPTYGASPTPQERFSHLVALADDPDIHLDFATIDPGAVNYAAFDRESNRLGPEFVLSVTHAECQYFLSIARQKGIQYSFTVRELGHIRHTLLYRRAGLVDGPLLFKLTLSENHAWGIPPSRDAVGVLRAAIPADVPYRWMLYTEGDSHADLCQFAVENGGHVRTGIGDNPLFDGESLSNAEQVGRVVEMARRVGREVANAAEARERLRRNP